MNWLDWIRWSGITVSVNLNPCHWRWIPAAGPEHNSEWGSPWRSWRASWLFVSVLVFLDNGNW